MLIATRLTIPVIGGPLCGQFRPLTGSSFVYESSTATRHEYVKSTDDAELVWRYIGATAYADAA